MNTVPATITAEVMEHTDGRPVAYIDATGVAVFVWQEPDGGYVVEIHTRDDIPSGRLRVLLDSQHLRTAGNESCGVGPSPHPAQAAAAGLVARDGEASCVSGDVIPV